MSLSNCIEAAVDTGKMTHSQADELREWQADYERALIAEGKHPSTAEREAGKLAVKALAIRMRREEWVKSLQLIAVTRLKDNIKSHPKGVSTGVMAVMGRDITRSAPSYDSVDMRAHSVRRVAHSMMAEIMQSLHPSVGDVARDIVGAAVDRTVIRNVVRELGGESTGDASAKVFAKQWKDTAEYLRVRFNRAGGDIKKLETWMLPQFHYDVALRKAGGDDWKAFITPLLDREKMLNKRGVKMTDRELSDLLDKTHERIIKHGLDDLDPGVAGSAKLANARQEHRVLHFNNADDWLKYSDKFGQEDIYQTMVSHVDAISQDIALLEIMGTNPEQSFNVMRDMARAAGAAGKVTEEGIDSLWNVVSGKVNHVGSVKWAAWMQGIRNTLTSAKLGSASLSALADIGFLRHTSKWANIPMYKVMMREMSLVGDKEQRLVAAKLMIGADVWSTKAVAAQRFTEVTGTGASAQLADMTMRVSGLSALTDLGKTAFGMELAARFADDFGKQFSEIQPDFRKILDLGGFTEADWAIMSSTKVYEHNGVKFFDPSELMKRTDISSRQKSDVLNKYLGTQSEMSIFAVPEPDARVRAITTMGQKRGTTMGELTRSVFQFKGFPTSVILTHFARGFYEFGGMSRANYLAQLAIATTAMGLVAMQAKEISKGREPRKLNAETLGAAFLQGGGAGLLGDFAHAGLFGTNRFGQSLFTSLAGPGAGLISDVTRVSFGQIGKGIEGEDINLPGDVVRAGRRYIPIASSLWYTRLVLDRTVFDQLELLTDPKAEKRFRLSERRRLEDYGQRPYWSKGDLTPRGLR